jgi:hypothetical protein
MEKIASVNTHGMSMRRKGQIIGKLDARFLRLVFNDLPVNRRWRGLDLFSAIRRAAGDIQGTSAGLKRIYRDSACVSTSLPSRQLEPVS